MLIDYGNEVYYQNNKVNYKIRLDKADSVHIMINISVLVEMIQHDKSVIQTLSTYGKVIFVLEEKFSDGHIYPVRLV